MMDFLLHVFFSLLGWLPRPRTPVFELPPTEIQWASPPNEDAGIFWGGIRLPKSLETHYLAMGTTRSGKTTALRLLMQDAFPDVAYPDRNTRALVYDPKREVHAILAGMGLNDFVVSLDPFGSQSYSWDLAVDITDTESAHQFAVMTVPRHESQEGSNYFDNAMRGLIESVVLALVDRRDSTGKSWSLRTVLNILEDSTLLRAIIARHPQGDGDILAYFEGKKDTSHDLRAVMRTYFKDYSVIASLWDYAEQEGRTFSIDQWIKSNRILILPAPRVSDDGHYDSITQLNRLVFGTIASRLLIEPEARSSKQPQRIWLVLDEFRSLGKMLPGLTQIFCQGASKGIRVVAGVLNLSGLQDALGHEQASEIFDLCAVKAFFRAGNEETAAVMAKQFGTIREIVEQDSYGPQGHTTNNVEVDRPILLDRAFSQLPLPKYDHANHSIQDLEGFYLVPGSTFPHAAFKSVLSMERLYGPNAFMRPIPTGYEFCKRPKHEQRLRPFTAEERDELLGTPRMPRPDKPSPFLRRLPFGSSKHLFRLPGEE